MFLHETHLQDKDNIKLKRGWVGQVFATSYSSFIRGVAILVSKKLAFQCLNCVKNDHGRYIIVKGTLLGKEVTFMNLYCPPGYFLPLLLPRLPVLHLQTWAGTLTVTLILCWISGRLVVPLPRARPECSLCYALAIVSVMFGGSDTLPT